MTDKRNPDPVSSGQNSEMGGGPIGQMTRYAMTVAGLDARNTKNRIGLIVGALLVVSLVGIVTIAGYFVLYPQTWFKPGEELFFDYGLVIDERYTPALKKRFECRCGAPKCRGTMLARKK